MNHHHDYPTHYPHRAPPVLIRIRIVTGCGERVVKDEDRSPETQTMSTLAGLILFRVPCPTQKSDLRIATVV